MRSQELLRRFTALVLTLATLAFAALGQGPAAPSLMEQRLEAYLLAGGTMADLCGTPESAPHAQDCGLCPLHAGASLAPPCPLSATRLAPTAARLLVATSLAPPRAQGADPHRSARAPPLA